MALTATYTAQLRTLSQTAVGFVDAARAQQGYLVSNANRVGLVCFPDLNLTGKTVTGISLTVTSAYSGSGNTKHAYFYQSNVQGIDAPTVTGNDYVGAQIGSINGYMYGNTATFTLSGDTLTNLVSYLTSGRNTLTLYESNPQATSKGWSRNYFIWTSVTMTVTYQEQTSQPTIDKTSADIWSDITISTNRESTSATHTLRYAFVNLADTIATDVTDSVVWTIPSDFMMQIQNAVSGVCTVYCDTYVDGVLVGTGVTQFTATLPSWVNPSVGGVDAVEATEGLADKFGAFVCGKSTLTVTVTGVGNWGSSPAMIQLAVGNQLYTATNLTIYQEGGNNAATAVLTTGTLTTSGEVALKATVTDTRGRTSTSTQTIAVLDYAAPKLFLFTAERCNSDGSQAQSDGTNVRISASASASSVNDRNDMAVQVDYRLKGAADWSAATTLAPSNYLVSVTNQKLTQTFDALSTYELRLTVSDYFTTVTQTAQVGTKAVIVDFMTGGKGVAFGKVAETENTVDFGWDVKLNAPLNVESGGTGASTVEQARENLGAARAAHTHDEYVNKSGDTMTGNLGIAGSNPAVRLTPTDQTTLTNGYVVAGSDATVGLQANRTDGDYRVLYNNAAADDASYGLTFTGTWNGAYAGYRVFHEGWAVPMANLPFKVAYGSVEASPTSGEEATLDYSAAGFTGVPVVVANYATAGANQSVNGFIKVYSKTTTSALLTLSAGSATKTYPVDWLAVGV